MSDPERAELIKNYVKAVSAANNEAAKKELFLALLTKLFNGKDDFNVIPQFAAGAEKSIANIERIGKASDHGRADTQYGSVIIEFEHDLKKTGAHARDQLAEYLAGNWNSGIKARFTLIATDCLTWIVYTLDYDSLIGLGKLSADKIKLEKADEIKVDPANPDAFYFFLDRYLFGSEPVPATLEEIRKRFGYGSDIFQAALIDLHKAFESVKDTPEMLTASAQWERFLRIAYSKFDAGEHTFLIHSYLSILAKMIAYEVISGDDYLDDNEIAEILTGEAFRRKNVANFTDNDFFRWTEKMTPALKNAFRIIADGLGEIDFSDTQEDILKGVYQELVDDDTRHKLGEYYTPDWLCAKVTAEMDPKPGQMILDPSCGSGSFLKAVANYLIENKPDISASELNDCLYGIDVHPLSVQITKATLLIAYGQRLANEPKPLRLNVYLANSLLLPTEDAALLGNTYHVSVDGKDVEVPVAVFTDYSYFSKLVEAAEQLAANDYESGTEESEFQARPVFENILGTNDKQITKSAHALYSAILTAKKANRNGIWAYVLANTYAPIALQGKFDMILGNPPWIVFRELGTKDYQEAVRKIAQNTGVYPDKETLNTHLELAAIFVGHCIAYFLKLYGKLAFVMPRSIFTADQHHKMREGKINHLNIEKLWDMIDVGPLFNVPSCVLFAKNVKDAQKQEQVDGFAWKGKLPTRNCGIETADESLEISDHKLHLSCLQDRTAWTEKPIMITTPPHYKKLFNQGATLVPRSLCFIDIDQDMSKGIHEYVAVQVRSCKDIYRDSKPPWDKAFVSGEASTCYLFHTALSSNVVPYGLTGSFIAMLPVRINVDGNVILLAPKDIQKSGHLKSAKLFGDMRKEWEKYRTEGNEEIELHDYLNWQNKLIRQNTSRKYAIIYTRAGSKAASCVIERDRFDLPFIIDNSSYYLNTNDKDEALYLCAFFNSDTPNEIITPFQTQGLYGARDIHKKILDVPLPEFDKKDSIHIEIVDHARKASDKITDFLKNANLDAHGNNMTTQECGRFRNMARKEIKTELDKIDKLIRILLMRRTK